MEIERLLKLEDTDEGKIEMIISNNLNLMYKGKAAVTIDNWDKLTNEILAWHKYEVEKLNMRIVVRQSEQLKEGEKLSFIKWKEKMGLYYIFNNQFIDANKDIFTREDTEKMYKEYLNI